MRIIVGWFNMQTGELVNIPEYDAVPYPDPKVWVPATVEIEECR